ncbi:MAG: hypothetical protein JWP09_445 [Candidatus Taylorbacteria bacterium]|nr:hypothetical protein [Candidatus Taylorbacteria bacterium]
MNTPALDPTITRFLRLTAYFICRLVDQPAGLVLKTLREHPRYKNTALFNRLTNDDFIFARKAVADAFGDLLSLPQYQHNDSETFRILCRQAILVARELGFENRAVDIEQNDPTILGRLQIYSQTVHECFNTFAPWVTKILTELPQHFNAEELSANASRDYWLVEKKFWSLAKQIMSKVSGFMEFFVTQYGKFLVRTIESNLNLIELYEPGTLDRATVPQIVPQIYSLGVADLTKNLREN